MVTGSGLDTTNANAMTYQTEELGFTILGGIRLDGLDRMRGTLKICQRPIKSYRLKVEI